MMEGTEPDVPHRRREKLPLQALGRRKNITGFTAAVGVCAGSSDSGILGVLLDRFVGGLVDG